MLFYLLTTNEKKEILRIITSKKITRKSLKKKRKTNYFVRTLFVIKLVAVIILRCKTFLSVSTSKYICLNLTHINYFTSLLNVKKTSHSKKQCHIIIILVKVNSYTFFTGMVTMTNIYKSLNIITALPNMLS